MGLCLDVGGRVGLKRSVPVASPRALGSTIRLRFGKADFLIAAGLGQDCSGRDVFAVELQVLFFHI
jgi:hypothetical protein